MKIIVLFEAQVWKEDSSNCPFSLFSHFFVGSLASFFIFLFFGGHLWPLFCKWASLASFISSHGQCSINNDHHTYNSILRAMMTL